MRGANTAVRVVNPLRGMHRDAADVGGVQQNDQMPGQHGGGGDGELLLGEQDGPGLGDAHRCAHDRDVDVGGYARPKWRQSLAAACAAHAGLGPASWCSSTSRRPRARCAGSGVIQLAAF